MREVLVGTRGLVALVDDGDYELVSQYSWKESRRSHTIYVRRTWLEGGRWRSQFMHSLIMGVVGVDHRNHNGLDNRRENLRLATSRQNNANRVKYRVGTSAFKGVTWNRSRQKWLGSVSVGGCKVMVYYGDSEIDAAHAVDDAASFHYGEFAFLNFPSDVLGNCPHCGGQVGA